MIPTLLSGEEIADFDHLQNFKLCAVCNDTVTILVHEIPPTALQVTD